MVFLAYATTPAVARRFGAGDHRGAVSVGIDGLWLALDGVEHQLLFRDFPWFRDEAVGDLFAVERPNRDHLRWPALDIDLAIDSVRDPAR